MKLGSMLIGTTSYGASTSHVLWRARASMLNVRSRAIVNEGEGSNNGKVLERAGDI
jgi:hypothetical protein